jgi:hypothetical protein
VDKPDLYDPKLNRSYAELAEHYDTLIDPARAAKPKDKPQVERPMPYVRDSFWRGREFTSVGQMQQQALAWCRDVAGQRHCRPLQGAAPMSVFAAVEAQTLRPLPRKPFVLATWSTGKIGPDIHVKVGKTLYSVPWQHIGRRVDARETPTVVQIFDHGRLIATHVRKTAGKQTDLSHYPPEKIAFKMRTPTWCRTRAGEIGAACVAVITELLAVNALFRLRAAQGVLGLAGKHGPDRLEQACARAIEVGDPSYRTIKGILAARAEALPGSRPATAGPQHTCTGLRSCSATSWPCPDRAARPPWPLPPRAVLTPAQATTSRPPTTRVAGASAPNPTSSRWSSTPPPPTSPPRAGPPTTRKHHDHRRHRAAPGAAHLEAVRDAGNPRRPARPSPRR